MKKVLLFLCCMGLIAVYGCSGDDATPEDFGKNYVKKQFSEIQCDLDDLDFTVTEDEKGSAIVKIEGEITYKKTLSLVKKDGKWMMACDAVKSAPKVKEAPKKVKAEKKADH